MPYDYTLLYRFWFPAFLIVISVLCSIFVLYHVLFNTNLRQSLNNHVIILLLILGLIIQLIDIPFVLNFIRLGSTWQYSIAFSQFWTFIDYGCYSAQLILFAWATIERHILIFHDRWLATRKKRFFFHYLPIISILTYCFFYYFTTIVFLSCGTLNRPSSSTGVPVPCVYRNGFYQVWDMICHQLIPTMTIVIFSIGLLIRVLYQKAHMRQAIQWRKQRKMTIKLLSIALLYQLFNFPWAFLLLCRNTKLITGIDPQVFTVASFLIYYLIGFFPFVCCGTLPEVSKKLKMFFCCQWQRTAVVHPTIISQNQRQTHRAIHRNI